MSAEYKSPVKNGGGGGNSANTSNSDGNNSGPTTPENDPNNSIMSKVKSRVSSILPNSLTKWFTPSNRNGNSRRRRHDDSESDEFEEDNRQISTSDSDNNLLTDRRDSPANKMPPLKRTRHDEGVPLSSTPHNNLNTQSSSIISKKRRKQHNFVVNKQAPPFNFNNSSTYLSNFEQTRTNGGDGIGNDDVTDEEIDDLPTSSKKPATFILENRKRLNIPQTNPAAAVVHTKRNGSNRMFGTTSNYESPTLRQHQSQQQQRFISNIPPSASSSRCIIHEEDNEVDDDVEDDDEDDDDNDGAEDEVELNGNVNESASESGCESSQLLLTSVGTNLLRPGGSVGGIGEITRSQSSAGRLTTQLSIDQQDSSRRGGGLYGIGGSSSKRSCSGLNSSGNLNFSTHLQSNKSLFSDKNMPASLNNSTTSLTSLNRRHSLTNASSLFGSTSALSDSRLLNTSTNSPFYKGRTMYGGASAYSARRASFAQRTVRVPTQIRPLSSLSSRSTSTNSLANIGISGSGTNGGPGGNNSEPNATPVISNTAKRILDLMNQFTSPLSDIKKMATRQQQQQQQQQHAYIPALVANRKRFDETDILSNRCIRMQTPKTPYSRPSVSELVAQQNSSDGTNKLSPMVTELQVPSMSQLLQMKKHLQNKTEKVRELASSSQSILNKKPTEYKPPIDQNDLSGGKKDFKDDSKRKIRNKIPSTRLARQSNNNNNNDEIVEPVNLPNIQLEFKNNNKTDGSIWNMTNNNNSSSSTNTQLTNSKIPTNSLTTASSANSIGVTSIPFKPQPSSFIETTSSKLLSSNSNNLIDYKFSNPLKQITPSFANTIEPINNFEFSKPISANDINSTNLDYNNFGSNKTQLITKSGGIEQITKTSPTLLKTGSVLDALKKPNVLPVATKITTENKLPEPQIKTLPSLSSLFKVATDKWECSSCMLKNDNAKLKCVACEGPKPGGGAIKSSLNSFSNLSNVNSFGTTSKTSITTTDTGFKSIVAQQNDKWECFACMTRNDPQRKKCICCEMDKPGASSKQSAQPAFTSGLSLTSSTKSAELSHLNKPTTDEGFKNIIAQQSSKWECSDCLTRNDSAKNKCDCCEKAKPGAVINKSSEIKLTTPVASNLDTGFKNIVAQQSSKWECSDCMTRNDSAKNKCDCCEKLKPGSTSEKPLTASLKTTTEEAIPKFSFGVPFDKNAKSSSVIPQITKSTTTATFSFGTPSAIKKPETTSTFSFGTLSPATTTPTTSTTIIKPTTADTKKDSTDSPLTGFKFGTASTTTKTNLPNETTNLVPLKSTSTLGNISTNTESAKSNTFTFGGPSTSTAVVSANTPKTSILTSPTQSSPAVIPTLSTPVTPKETTSNAGLFSFGSSLSTSSTSIMGQPSKSGFSFGNLNSATSSSMNSPSTVALANPSATSTTTITSPSLFGAPSAAIKSQQQTELEKKSLSNNGGGLKFGLPTSALSTPPTTSAVPVTKTVPFVFGSGPTPSTSTITNNDDRKGGFSFSATAKPIETVKPSSLGTETTVAAAAAAAANLVSFGGVPNNSVPQFGASATPAPTTKSAEPNKSTFIFGSASSAPSSSLSTNINAHSTVGTTPTFGASSINTTTTTTNNFFGTGTNNLPASTTPSAIGSHFGGSPAPSPSTSLFGSAIAAVTSSNNTTNNVATVVAQPTSSAFMFGGASTNNPVATPSFGQSTSTATFGQPQQQQQQQQQQHTSQLPAFGSFGNSQSPGQQQQQQTPVATFGSPSFGNASPFSGGGIGGGVGAATAGVGSGSGVTTPSFGQQIPSLAFGSGSTFGGIQAQSQQNTISFSATPSAQGFSAPSNSDEPQTKKLFSGGFPTGNNSNIQKPLAYSFGAVANNPTESKAPFSFSTNTPPSFNFSSPQPTQQLNQPYTFGATNNVAPSPGVFNFGSGPSESTTIAPFQFAAEANNTNLFSPQPTAPTANATQRRKIRAVRRNIR